MPFATILQFIGALVLLIIIHEFGHYIAARIFGVEVEEFGIGFPPRALQLFTWKGTLFSLNWIPLGGFVRPKGENDPTVEGGLAAATPWVRIAVFLAGPLANLLTAVLLYTLIFARAGLPDDSVTQVVGVASGSPAAAVGMLPDDLILNIGGVEIDSTQTLVDAIAANLGQETSIVVERAGEPIEYSLVPRQEPPPGEGAIGITFSHPRIPISTWQALGYGYQSVTFQIGEILRIPSRLINGTVQPEQARLVGYVSMARMFQSVREQEADSGMPAGTNTLAFFAYISLSLGLLNLLPIPAVDGGRIAFALPEILIRKRIPTRFENAVNLISFGLLLLLLIYVNINDVINPVNLVP
jgi:regulator of sigma E protease